MTKARNRYKAIAKEQSEERQQGSRQPKRQISSFPFIFAESKYRNDPIVVRHLLELSARLVSYFLILIVQQRCDLD